MCCKSAGVVWVAFACGGRLSGIFGVPCTRWWRSKICFAAPVWISECSLLRSKHVQRKGSGPVSLGLQATAPHGAQRSKNAQCGRPPSLACSQPAPTQLSLHKDTKWCYGAQPMLEWCTLVRPAAGRTEQRRLGSRHSGSRAVRPRPCLPCCMQPVGCPGAVPSGWGKQGAPCMHPHASKFLPRRIWPPSPHSLYPSRPTSAWEEPLGTTGPPLPNSC